MFSLGTEWWQIIVRASVVYIVVLLALRLTGRRTLGQRNAIDLVLILIVANAVQNAMIGSDTSLTGGLIAAATLFALDTALDRIFGRSDRLSRLFSGSPVVLVNRGMMIESNLRKEHISLDELEEALREHGIDDIGQVKLGILEMDGSLSIVPSGSTSYHSRTRIKGHRGPVGEP
jgi:uncharacterized membrane protein YcaP (DUF421 family)